MIEPLQSDEALLDDINSVSKGSDALHVWWLGQSGYLIEFNDTRVLIDPYLSESLTEKYANTDKPHVRISRRVIDPAKLTRISFVTASHGHTDHLDALTLKAIRDADEELSIPWRPMLVAPRAIADLAQQRWGGEVEVLLSDGESESWGSIAVHAVLAAHPNVERDEAGASKFLGYVFDFGDFRIYHSGDTQRYDGMDQILREKGPFDIAILPINGQVGNMNGRDAAGLAQQIGAKLVIPCHYDLFDFNTADHNALFVPECQRLAQAYRVLQLGERLTLTKPHEPAAKEHNEQQDEDCRDQF